MAKETTKGDLLASQLTAPEIDEFVGILNNITEAKKQISSPRARLAKAFADVFGLKKRVAKAQTTALTHASQDQDVNFEDSKVSMQSDDVQKVMAFAILKQKEELNNLKIDLKTYEEHYNSALKELEELNDDATEKEMELSYAKFKDASLKVKLTEEAIDQYKVNLMVLGEIEE